MRQVPISTYLIVGDGKLATHLSYYLSKLNLNILKWSRSQNSVEDLQSKVKKANYILLAINDDAIVPFFEEHELNNRICVHFSGQLYHEKIFGFHPLMTFSNDLYDEEFYKTIPFIGDVSEIHFREIFPEMKNEYHKVKPEDKAYYHSLCVLSGNGTTLLWELVGQQMANIDLPEEILKPYLLKVCENILFSKPGRWTGPWYRKDLETVNSHLESIKDDQLSRLYSTLCQLSQNINPQKGAENEDHSSDATI